MLGLYIHIPFCSAICNYCNFNRGLFDADLKVRYVDALILEIREAGLRARTTGEMADSGAPPGAGQTFRSDSAAADTITAAQMSRRHRRTDWHTSPPTAPG